MRSGKQRQWRLMDKIKNTLITIVVIAGIVAILGINVEEKQKNNGNIRIGVSDDTSGFVINYMKSKGYLNSTEVETLIESHSINDC